MPWDKSPWFPGLVGAKVSAEVARLLAYMALGGNEGVGGPNDCKVVPTGVSSGKVNVMPGGAAMLNRSAAPDGAQQMYVGRLPSIDPVDIDPTPVGARSDLVIAKVEDPQYPGFAAPTDPTTAQIMWSRVIKGVSPSLTSHRELNLPYPAVALARIDMPAGKSAVEVEYIVDLREIAQPKRKPEQRVSAQPPDGQSLEAAAFARWITPAVFDISVPVWATHYAARIDVLNAIHTGANVYGVLGVFAGKTGSGTSLVASNPYAVENNAAATRVPSQSALTNGEVRLPSNTAGSQIRFELQGRRDGGTGYLTTDMHTRVTVEVTFLERAV